MIMLLNTAALFLFVQLVLTSSAQTSLSWLQPCGSNGVVDCRNLSPLSTSSKNVSRLDPAVIAGSATTLTISNCTYLFCPQVQILNGASASFQNVSFIASDLSDAVRGGAVLVNAASAAFSNCRFRNLTSTSSGGAIAASASSLAITRSSFSDNAAQDENGGGDICLTQSSLQCVECEFRRSLALNRGGSIAAWQGSSITWTGGSCINTSAAGGSNPWGGCIGAQDANSFISVSNVIVDGSTAKMGSAFFFQFGITATLRNVTVVRSTAQVQGGCVYVYSDSQTYIYDSQFSGCHAYGGNGGFAYVQSRCTFHLVRSTVFDSFATGAGGGFYVQDATTIELRNSTISGVFAKTGTVHILGPTSYLRCLDGSLLSDSVTIGAEGGAGVFMAADTYVDIYECTLRNNSADGFAGGIYLQQTGTLHLHNGSRLIGNSATLDGGAIYVAQSGVVILDGDATVLENNASRCGGAFAMVDSETNFTIASDAINVQNNTAPKGGLGCISSTPTAFFGTSLTYVDESAMNGIVWVELSATALSFVSKRTFKPFTGVLPQGRASKMVLFGNTTMKNVTLNVHQSLPNLTVVAEDVFGNVCPVVEASPVVVQLRLSTQMNATIVGESVKAIVDSDKSSVRFSGVTLNGPPGQYDVEVTAVKGTADHLKQFPWPVLHVTISDCNPETEVYMSAEERCFPVKRTGTVIRAAVGSTSSAFLLFSLFLTAALHRYRANRIVKANSVLFLIIACTGSSLSLFSIGLSLAPSWSCVAQPWFDNIGFTLVFAAIILKTYRIMRVFDGANIGDVGLVERLSDRALMRYLVCMFLCMCAFLTAWNVISPPWPQTTLVYSFVTVDRCQLSAFSTVATFIRLLVQVAAAWLAFNIRNVHADFNESRFIGFATYNWAVFGALLGVIANQVVADPEIAYIIQAVSIVVPNLITVLLLGGVKIYQCIFHPEIANAEDETDKQKKNVALFSPRHTSSATGASAL